MVWSTNDQELLTGGPKQKPAQPAFSRGPVPASNGSAVGREGRLEAGCTGGRRQVMYRFHIGDSWGRAYAYHGAGPAITVTKAVRPTTAAPGVTLTYSYRVTNTGKVTLTGVAAVDDRLGAVPLRVSAARRPHLGGVIGSNCPAKISAGMLLTTASFTAGSAGSISLVVRRPTITALSCSLQLLLNKE